MSGKILVTGGCGFIGAPLCRRLVESGTDVVVVDDLRRGASANLGPELDGAVDLRELDVTDGDRIERLLRGEGIERVVHLAAIHFIPDCETDPTAAIRVNVEGTQALLGACAAAGGLEGVVVASSGAVYRPSDEALGEDAPLGPTDVYGHTKRWTEELVQLFRARTGIPTAVARIFNTFGPGETNPHLIPSVAVQLTRGSRISVGNLSSRRDYVFVADVATALQALVEACGSLCSPTFNVGRGEAVEGREIVRLLAELAGHEAEVVEEASRLRADDRPLLLSDPGLARKQLGWEAAVGLREGLADVLERPLAPSVTAPKS